MEGGSALGGAAAAAKVDFRVSGARSRISRIVLYEAALLPRCGGGGQRGKNTGGRKKRERERREEEERRAILRRSSIPRTARNPERATVLEPTPETMSAGRVAVLGALTQRTSPQAINEAFA